MEEVIEVAKLPLLIRGLQHIEFPHKLGLCEKLFAQRLAKLGVCWVKTAPGPNWKLDLSNSTHRWIVYGYYEGATLFNWIRQNLPENPVIVDSGANIGQMTLYFGTYFPKARILSFEPGDYQANWLSECLANNRQLSVKLFRQGLSDSENTLYLQNVGHKHSHGGQNVVTAEAIGDPIPVVRLSEVLDAEKISIIDLWKLDVEGSELAALRGAREWLETKRIRALWIETMGENGRRIVDFMTGIGYRACLLNRQGRQIQVCDHAADNTLFLPT
jgi:FkbM family methyltransferase